MLNAALLCLVIGVSDGDTLRAQCENTPRTTIVRLAGIDAPEYHQPYGNQARKALRRLTLGRTVELRCHKVDNYQRDVCSVWASPESASEGPRTLDAGHALLSLGMAWWYQAYAHEQTAEERGQYEFTEQEARLHKAGLWASPDPIPPWKWRAQHRQPR